MLMNTYIATGEGANRYEKIPVQIYEEPATAVVTVAKEIANLIRSKAEKNEKCVLGLLPWLHYPGTSGEPGTARFQL